MILAMDQKMQQTNCAEFCAAVDLQAVLLSPQGLRERNCKWVACELFTIATLT